ncbi:hypothetical protein M8C21_009270 [Ambrosia artemisiifolia]|uniref:Uncharacterized protein n=1 Tax=Ambrosia artemisiifolia TaxID=4212 RepID=A0AAD5CMY0_AMBAR|nr:hypothetical protein M8C21_009270 [Ambrosia artemisiifolia]
MPPTVSLQTPITTTTYTYPLIAHSTVTYYYLPAHSTPQLFIQSVNLFPLSPIILQFLFHKTLILTPYHLKLNMEMKKKKSLFMF